MSEVATHEPSPNPSPNPAREQMARLEHQIIELAVNGSTERIPWLGEELAHLRWSAVQVGRGSNV